MTTIEYTISFFALSEIIGVLIIAGAWKVEK